MYLEGLNDDEDIPFRIQEAPASGKEITPGVQGPTIRTGVDAGVHVIDLAAMRDELEELRRKKAAEQASLGR